jgi:ABC-type multidrug transport system ATPase subunit
MGEVEQVCDRVGVIRGGRLVAEGTQWMSYGCGVGRQTCSYVRSRSMRRSTTLWHHLARRWYELKTVRHCTDSDHQNYVQCAI